MKRKRIKAVYNSQDLVEEIIKSKKGTEIVFYEQPVQDMREFREYQSFLTNLIIGQRSRGLKITGCISVEITENLNRKKPKRAKTSHRKIRR